MTDLQNFWFRMAVLATLVKKAPKKPGRTAMMKFAYLLQSVRNVPLGYHFTLYNYGPYDSTVLGDLSQATSLKAIKTEVIRYSNGEGYEYSPGKSVESVASRAESELSEHDEDIAWVLDNFGNDSASHLELVTTIHFANSEAPRKKQDQSPAELARRVREIKPHFSEETIEQRVYELADRAIVVVTKE